jgi:hypothetical protein
MFLYSRGERSGFQYITKHRLPSCLPYIGKLNADYLNIFPLIMGLQYH